MTESSVPGAVGERADWPKVEPGTACPECRAILHGYPCIHHEDGCPILKASGGAVGEREEPLDPDRLTAIIKSRMSRDLAWLGDDGVTVNRRSTPEQVGWAIAHLYATGDVVSGLPPLSVNEGGPTDE